MPNGSNGNTVDKRTYEIYMLAGFATAPRFMERLGIALAERLVQSGATVVRTEALFPYGDWSRSKLSQLREIFADMRLAATSERLGRSIGGRSAADAVRSFRSADELEKTTTLLLGHSGGGIAAVHAAHLLLDRRERSSCFAVMIGSPRCRIPTGLRHHVLSIDAARLGRRRPDFVPRLGTHGWRGQHAPGSRTEVRIIGGHADYFRETSPYIDGEGMSNLDRTLNTILDWLSRVPGGNEQTMN
ncbi:hypothetical protein [Cohnella soli]|uniref:Alpha/beta hydrolase n=1 Tax=Cohnella soli TaxID=425005 RepID=A0ABW0HVM3_9BACL